MRGLARLRGALGALLVASLAAVGVSAVGTADRASAAEESDGKPRQIYAGGPAVYLVDHAGGTVQALDPVSLAPRGKLHDLGYEIGRPVVDPEGTLWAPLESSGEIMPVRSDASGPSVDVGAGGDRLWLTLAGGRLVVTNPGAQQVSVVGLGGVESEYKMPAEVLKGNIDSLLVPTATESSLVPLLAKDQKIIFWIDIDKPPMKGAALPPDILAGNFTPGVPQALGELVIIPDLASRQFWPIDTVGSRGTPEVADGYAVLLDAFGTDVNAPKRRVGGDPGPIPMMVQGGSLWWDPVHGSGEGNGES